MDETKSVVICQSDSLDLHTGMWRFHRQARSEASDVNLSYGFAT